MLLNLLKYGLSEGIVKIVPFLTTLYVAKSLAPELFGMYSLLISAFEVLFIFISFNIQATTRIDYFKMSKYDFYETKKNHILLTLGIASTILLFLFFIPPEFKLILVLLVITAILRTFSVFIMAIFQCEKKVNNYILSNIIFVIFLSVFTYVFLDLGLSFNSWLYAILIASIFQLMLVVNLLGLKKISLFIPQKIELNSLKLTFIPALLFLPQAIGWWLKSGAERIIISDNYGLETLGYYTLAYQLTSLVIIGVTVINLALVPEINISLKNKRIKLLKKIIFATILFITIISLFIPFSGQLLINYYYGLEYNASIKYMKMLIIPLYIQAILMVLVNILYYMGYNHVVAKLVLITFSLQILVAYFSAASLNLFWLIQFSSISNLVILIIVIICTHNVLNKLR